MTANTWTIVIIGSILLGVLLIEPLRKIVALAILVTAAFALGWYWPKVRSYGVAQAASPPCVSAIQ